jgi:hypothetical protein
MRPCKFLPQLGYGTNRRYSRLANMVVTAHGRAGPIVERIISFVTIEVQSTWSNFARCFYLSCAMGCREGRRSRISAAVSYATVNDALGAAILQFRPKATPLATGMWHRRDEPAWHEPRTLEVLAIKNGWTNLATIQSVFSLRSRALVDLPVFRNFYAHRSVENLRAASAQAPMYGHPTSLRPTQVLLSIPIGGRGALLSQWIEELSTMSLWLCGK